MQNTTQYECHECNTSFNEDQTSVIIVGMGYLKKVNRIITTYRVMCPMCGEVTNIIFEEIEIGE